MVDEFEKASGIHRCAAWTLTSIENIRPYAGSFMARQLLPSFSWKDMYKALRDLNRFLWDLLTDASRVIRELKEKGLELQLKHEYLEEFGVRIEWASNRLSFSLIIAAVIIGSSKCSST